VRFIDTVQGAQIEFVAVNDPRRYIFIMRLVGAVYDNSDLPSPFEFHIGLSSIEAFLSGERVGGRQTVFQLVEDFWEAADTIEMTVVLDRTQQWLTLSHDSTIDTWVFPNTRFFNAFLMNIAVSVSRVA
jgi:hypothetical protein